MKEFVTLRLTNINNVLPGNIYSRYKVEVEDEYMVCTSFKKKEIKKNLFYAYFEAAEFGLYNGCLLLQTVYNGFSFVFSLSLKDWKSEVGKQLLRKINLYTAILDPIKYYKTAYKSNPFLFLKSDKPLTKVDAIRKQIKDFLKADDFKTNFDKKVIVFNIQAFLIKNLVYKKMMEEAKKETLSLINYLIELNKEKEIFNNLISFYYRYLIRFLDLEKDKEEIKEYVKLSNEVIKRNLEISNDPNDLIFATFILFENNFNYDFIVTSKQDVNWIKKTIEDLIEKYDNFYCYLDLRSLLAALVFEDKEIQGEFNEKLVDELVSVSRKIKELEDYHENDLLLCYALSVKAKYYFTKEDNFSAKELLLEEKEILENCLAKVKLKKNNVETLHSKNLVTKFELNSLKHQLVDTFVNLCNITHIYNNTYEEIGYLKDMINLDEELLRDKFYDDMKDRDMSFLNVLSYFINVSLENNYENFEDVSKAIFTYFTYSRECDKKYNDEFVKDHVIKSSINMIKLVCEPTGNIDHKIKCLDDIIKASDEQNELNKERLDPYDAKTYAFSELFRIFRDIKNDKERALKCAKFALQNMSKIDKKLLEEQIYIDIMNECNDYIQKNN